MSPDGEIAIPVTVIKSPSAVTVNAAAGDDGRVGSMRKDSKAELSRQIDVNTLEANDVNWVSCKATPRYRSPAAETPPLHWTQSYDAAYRLATLQVDGGNFTVPHADATIGQHHRITIAAGDVSLATELPRQTTVPNILSCRIISAARTDDHQMVAVLGLGKEGKGARLLARVTKRSWDQLKLSEGTAVYSQVKGVAFTRV